MNETVVILGNRTTCSYCKKLWGITSADKTPAQKMAKVEMTLSAIRNILTGADVVDADYVESSVVYKKYRPSGGFQWPTCVILNDNGKAIGKFVARNMTVSTFTKKVLKICPSCDDNGASEDTQETCGSCGGTGKCPTCGGDGLVQVNR